MGSPPDTRDRETSLPARVSPGRQPHAIMTPQGDALHRNFLRAVHDLKRDLVRVIYYLDQIRTRRIHRALGYTSIADYAHHVAGISPAQTRRFPQLGRQLQDHPLIARALASNDLSFAKALFICSNTPPDDQQAMLELARALTLEQLREHVEKPGSSTIDVPDPEPEATTDPPSPTGPRSDARAPGGNPREAAMPDAPEPPAMPPPAPEPTPHQGAHHIQLKLTDEQYQRWSSLLDHLLRRHQADTVAAVLNGLDALASGSGPSAAGDDVPPPPHLVVLLRCPECGKATLPVRDAEAPAPDALLAAAHCDATVESADGQRRSIIPPRLRRLAFQRARMRCENPGCSQTRFLEIHHRTPMARGGKHHVDNLIVLCWRCHRKLHEEARAAAQGLRNAP